MGYKDTCETAYDVGYADGYTKNYPCYTGDFSYSYCKGFMEGTEEKELKDIESQAFVEYTK